VKTYPGGMKMKKRSLSLVGMLMIVALIVAACGSGNNGTNGGNLSESGEITNKKVKLMRTYHAGLEQFKGSDNINSNKLYNLLKEWSGYNINYETLPKDNASQKISVILASGDVPDLMHIPGKSDYFKLAQQGSFEPLDDLVEKYIPNLSSVFSKEQLDAARLDGVLYGLPVRVAQKVGNGVLIHDGVFKELGLKDPTTLDEMYNVLKTIKEQKNIIPLTAAASNPGSFMGAFSPISSMYGVGNTTVEKDGKLAFSWIQPEYKTFLETMNKWFKEGLIDQEFAINKDVKDKMITATAAMSVLYWADAKIIDDAIAGKGGTLNSVRYIDPPVGPNGQSGVPEQSLANSFVVIPKQAKNKEGAADYYNFLLEEKTDTLITFGIENEDYTVEDGKVVQTPEQSNEIPWRTLYFNLDTDTSFNARLGAKGFLPYYNQLLEHKQNREETAYAPFIEAYDTKLTELSNYVAENSIKFIMGNRDLSEFDAFVSEFNAKGGQKAIDEMNEWFTSK
jgi:putative aldouronate transport system substrate-binding protein